MVGEQLIGNVGGPRMRRKVKATEDWKRAEKSGRCLLGRKERGDENRQG